MAAWRGEGDFLSNLIGDRGIGSYLQPNEIRALFDLGFYTKHVDEIFERVFSPFIKARDRLRPRARDESGEEKLLQ
jgi:hypothetical protein